MYKQVSGFIFFACLLLSLSITLFGSVSANPTPQRSYITITASGEIEPQTELIRQEGNIYRLTVNVTFYAVKIQCSNIVFDGAGYYILGAEDEWSHPKWWPGNSGLLLDGVMGVVVQNVKVLRFYQGITLDGCANCSVFMVETENINLLQSDNNTISQNNVINTSIPTRLQDSSNNLIYRNNFTLVGVVGANSWDNGSVGNYWTQYSGVDSNGDGIGDTPHVIGAGNVDNYPSIVPVMVQKETQPTPSIEPQLGPETDVTPLLLIISVVSVILIVVCALISVYFNRKTTTNRRLSVA